MRILVLVSDAFGGHGGIALYNRHFLRALCAYPHLDEVVAVPRRMPNPAEPLPSKLTYVTTGLNSKLRYLATTFNIVQRNPEFNLIVCGHLNLLPVAYLLSRWVRAPVLLIIYGLEAWQPHVRPKEYTGGFLEGFLIGNINAFVSVSGLTKERFLGWANLRDAKGFVLPCAIDLECFGPGPKNPVLLNRYGLSGKTVLMTLGRLGGTDGRYKGFDKVLELLPTLTRDVPNISYLIAGDGPDRQRLEAKTKSLGMDERVVFAGLISETEKADHYRLADAYVMPSRAEGFGIVFIEAMACGVPVVASNVDGSREAVRGGELGILVNPDNPEEVKAGILEALNRPKGVVPEGLSYFSYANFEKRCHHIVDRILEGQNERSRG